MTDKQIKKSQNKKTTKTFVDRLSSLKKYIGTADIGDFEGAKGNIAEQHYWNIANNLQKYGRGIKNILDVTDKSTGLTEEQKAQIFKYAEEDKDIIPEDTKSVSKTFDEVTSEIPSTKWEGLPVDQQVGFKMTNFLRKLQLIKEKDYPGFVDAKSPGSQRAIAFTQNILQLLDMLKQESRGKPSPLSTLDDSQSYQSPPPDWNYIKGSDLEEPQDLDPGVHNIKQLFEDLFTRD